jgi:hypothetical protein
MKSFKRIAFAGWIGMSLFGASHALAAPVAVRFDPASPTVGPEGLVTVTLLGDIPDPVIGYGLDLNFDPTALSLDGVTVASPWFSATAFDGSPLVGLAFPDPVSGSSLVLATARFRVISSQCEGTTTISVSAKPDDLSEGFALATGGFADLASGSATVSLAAPPKITNAVADRPVLGPPNHKMMEVALSYDVRSCSTSGAVACSISVSSNEPTNGTGDGDTAPDWEVIDAHHVRLRAERAGAGAGRIYTNTIRCEDSAGRISTQDVLVRVPHDQR